MNEELQSRCPNCGAHQMPPWSQLEKKWKVAKSVETARCCPVCGHVEEKPKEK